MSIRFHRTALVEPAKADEAVAFAAAVSAYATANFGQVTSWGLQVGGTYGTLHWFTDFADMTEFEVTSGRTLTDEGYRALMAKSADLFVTGSVQDTLIHMV